MTDKKPVLFYAVKRLSGGILTFLTDLSNRLIETYDISIAFYPDSETPQQIRTLFDPRVKMYSVTSFESDGNPLTDGGGGTELKALCEEIHPDIIHLHGFGAGRIGRKIFANADIPVFYTPHGYLFLAEDHNRITKSMYRRIEKNLAKTNCVTIACSRSEYAEALAFSDTAVYVNNGINTESIDQLLQETAIPDHPLTVYTSGLINPQKNPALFNEIAMAMPDVQFVWIGDGEMRYKLTAPNTKITGWLPREEALKQAASADVFILTSLWEGLPLTLLEAMYMNKLCVVSNVAGSKDLIVNGETGFVCNSAAAFVNAIHQCRENNVSDLIANAREEVVENYTIEKMVQGYDAIYKKALGR